MAASSAQAAKDSLFAMLQANTSIGVAGVQVTYGPPGPNVAGESVWLGRVASTELPSQLGQNKRREDYTIDVVILVARDGNDIQAYEQRLSVLRNAVETMLQTATGRTLNGAVNLWAEVVGFETDSEVADNGGQWLCLSVVKVGCAHRK